MLTDQQLIDRALRAYANYLETGDAAQSRSAMMDENDILDLPPLSAEQIEQIQRLRTLADDQAEPFFGATFEDVPQVIAYARATTTH